MLLKSNRFDEISKVIPNSTEQIMEMQIIRSMIREVGRGPIQQALEQEIIKLSSQMNITNNITSSQVPLIAETLLDVYPTESLADFILCFKRIAIGYYGNTYHRLDSGVIVECFSRHLEEKCDYRERDNSNSKKAEQKYVDVDYKAFSNRLESERRQQKEWREVEIEKKKQAFINDIRYDEFKKERLKTAEPTIPVEKLFTVGQMCGLCNGDGTIEDPDGLIEMCEYCKGEGEVNRKIIKAKDEDEAKKLYTP